MNSDVPEVGPVLRKGRVDPVPIVVALAAAFVVMAAWKPWQPAPQPTAQASAVAVLPPSAAASPVPSLRASAPAPRPTTAEPLVVDAIDWTATGTRETYRSWGISVAYLPFRFIDEALVLRESSIRPTVQWIAVPPGATTSAAAGVSGAPVVGLAITWPLDVTPVDVGLRYLGSAPGDRPTPAVAASSGEPVSIARNVPTLLQAAENENALGPYVGRSPEPASELPASGTYVLPPATSARTIIDWLSGGWRPGLYAATLQLEDGRSVVLPFLLDSGV